VPTTVPRNDVTVPLGPADASAGHDRRPPARIGLPVGKAELSRTGWSGGGRQTGVNLTTRRAASRLNRCAGAVNIDRRATRVKHNEQQHSGGRRAPVVG